MRKLGLKPGKGETEDQRQERLSPDVEKRGSAAEQFVAQVEREMVGKPNPFAASVARTKDTRKLEERVAKTRSYLVQQMLSPANVTAAGRVTPEGQERIRNARLLLQALADRQTAIGLQ